MVRIYPCIDVFDGLDLLYKADYKKDETFNLFQKGCKRIIRQSGIAKGFNIYKGMELINDQWFYFSYATKNFRYSPNIEKLAIDLGFI